MKAVCMIRVSGFRTCVYCRMLNQIKHFHLVEISLFLYVKTHPLSFMKANTVSLIWSLS